MLDTYAPIFFRNQLHDGRPRLLSELATVATTLQRVAPGDRWNYLRNKGRVAQEKIKAFFLRPVNAKPEDSCVPEPIRRVESAGRQALANYVPLPYAGSAVVFRATDLETPLAYDPVLWWREVVQGSFTVLNIPGDHHAIIQNPSVALLARQLRESLDQADNAAR